MLARGERQDVRRLGVDQLREEQVGGEEMQPGVVLALGREVGEDVRDAVIGVARLHAPGLAQPRAQGRIVEARLAAEEAEPQAQIPGRQAREALFEHPLQHGRIGRRAGDRVDADLADRADQKLAPADPERHHEGTRLLQGQVIGEPAHPHLIAQAMDDGMPGPEAGGAVAPPAHDLGDVAVLGRQSQVHRLAGGARGAVEADRGGAWRGEVAAEGRMQGLRAAERGLVGQRQRCEILQIGRRLPASPELMVERGAFLDMLTLALPQAVLERAKLGGRKEVTIPEMRHVTSPFPGARR